MFYKADILCHNYTNEIRGVIMIKIIGYLEQIFGGGIMNKKKCCKDVNVRYEVTDIANYFLCKKEMTPKKLQKILYFAYSWYLAMMNESRVNINVKLFNNAFEAWIHGPVCHEIYSKYKSHGASLIPKYKGELPNINEDDKEILDQVWDVYNGYTANQLESITHQHLPWKETREENGCSSFDWCDAEISDEKIFDYYSARIVEENE